MGAAWARLGRTWMLRMACGASPGPPPAPRGHAEPPGPMLRTIIIIIIIITIITIIIIIIIIDRKSTRLNSSH